MASLLSKLNGTAKKIAIEPREIFMTLPQKDKRYEYPRDVQSDVWKKWFDNRDEKNCIIKMNTGSGKTVVGLMILQSCLNEGKGPAVYVVPDSYLVSQVCEEAKKLGITAVIDRDDYLYTENRAILVTTIHTLVNGRSAFGMRSSNNYPIGSVLIDDVHACLDTITTQFSIKIPSSHNLYTDIVDLFAEQWKQYNYNSYINIIENRDPTKTAIIPFWIWQEKKDDMYALLSKYNTNEESNMCIYFNFPLINDSLITSDCFITSRGIEIIPEGISISKIRSFEEANRRIFMSATLADDSIFATTIGLGEQDINNIISPDTANDVGDRLILFPRHLNSAITDDEIKNKVYAISKEYNVVVIVPSFERAKYWDPLVQRTVNRDNIEQAVTALKQKHVGLSVFVNRYDGIDLPDDSCRLLVIDGLPPLRNEKDKYIQSIDSYSTILRREQIQRIEQGMGRGVRSNSDSCCIVLMGDDLADVLLRNNGTAFFSNTTREQYNLSKELWDLLKQEVQKPNVDDVFELADFSLNRDVEWIQKSKERVSAVKYKSEPQFDNNTLLLRKAYDLSVIFQYVKSIEALDNAINAERQKTTKGYLMQIKAKYMNLIDRSNAQQILLSGKAQNIGILSPIDGIRYDKSINNMSQVKNICKYINDENFNPNSLVIHFNDIASKLTFSQDADEFETALKKTGSIIGFVSTRPDKETNGEGPDNLWALGNNTYFVIECKNAAVAGTISKDYCNQLGGSIRWFAQEYGDDYYSTPIMVHKSTIIDKQATAVENMRVITEEKLELLKANINGLVIAISQNDNWFDENKISNLLNQYKLRNSDIIDNYTLPFRNQ
ncbi:MAG: DEAD/DEAH box helicase family protein [Oscillospiraceae bacterium]|nr:DEAD/DEAH box helicase family protein [Oscillospiraceae bacterium]